MSSMFDRHPYLTATAAGAVAGTFAWFLVKPLVERQLKSTIRTQLEQQIPQQLNAQLDSKLRSYGFTPETGRQVARLISAASRTGVI